jgi:hypothetical protein
MFPVAGPVHVTMLNSVFALLRSKERVFRFEAVLQLKKGEPTRTLFSYSQNVS